MFGNSLDNLWKSTGERKNKHSNKFPKFLKIFGNLREKIGKCRKVLKITFQHFWNFFEIFGNCTRSSEIFGSLRKNSENVGKLSKRSSNTFWKFSKIFGNLRKCLENFGNPRKIFECNRRFMKFSYTIPISATFGLKVRFKNFDL